mgnify:FL=1
MIIKGMKPITSLIIPDNLKNKILLASSCELTDREKFLFKTSLEATSMMIEKDNLKKIHSTNVFFTHSGEIHFFPDDDMVEIGTHFRAITYRLDILRSVRNDKFIMFAFIEEMAHNFWDIEDEIEVKYKVMDIINQFIPGVTIDTDELRRWKIYGFY